MADFKFFNIGKANAEITRLEEELTKAQASAIAATENATAIEVAAESMKKDLTQARADLETAKASISSLTSANEKAVKELADAKATIADPKGAIETSASKKAQQITATQGQPPITATPTAESGNVLEQLAAIKDPTEKNLFWNKNKAAIRSAYLAQSKQ